MLQLNFRNAHVPIIVWIYKWISAEVPSLIAIVEGIKSSMYDGLELVIVRYYRSEIYLHLDIS